MSSINPILPRNFGVQSSRGPVGGRQAALLKEIQGLSKNIKSQWDELAPEELAEKIIDLEDKVALIEGKSSTVEKVKKVAEKHHFNFVFQLHKQIASFARSVLKDANEMAKTNSMGPFEALNKTQQQEVMRYATREGA